LWWTRIYKRSGEYMSKIWNQNNIFVTKKRKFFCQNFFREIELEKKKLKQKFCCVIIIKKKKRILFTIFFVRSCLAIFFRFIISKKKNSNICVLSTCIKSVEVDISPPAPKLSYFGGKMNSIQKYWFFFFIDQIIWRKII